LAACSMSKSDIEHNAAHDFMQHSFSAPPLSEGSQPYLRRAGTTVGATVPVDTKALDQHFVDSAHPVSEESQPYLRRAGTTVSNQVADRRDLVLPVDTKVLDQHFVDFADEELVENDGISDRSRNNVRFNILILATAIVASWFCFCVEDIATRLASLPSLLDSFTGKGDTSSDLAIHFGFVWVLLCGARLVCQYNLNVIGSGIPEIKCMLSGKTMTGFLYVKKKQKKLCSSCWTLRLPSLPSLMLPAAKGLGLALALGAGMPLGNDGPFVYIAASVGVALLNMKIFGSLPYRMFHEALLMSAVSIGICATFGTPIAALLFTFELAMPHTFTVDLYTFALVAATAGGCTFTTINFVRRSGHLPMITSDISPEPVLNHGILLTFCLWSILGGINGFLGALFVKLLTWFHQGVQLVRNVDEAQDTSHPNMPWSAWKGPSFLRDMLLMSLYAGLVVALTPTVVSLNDLFSAKHEFEVTRLMPESMGYLLFVAVSLNMPVPGGCIRPFFSIGAIVGRIFGELLPSIVWVYIFSANCSGLTSQDCIDSNKNDINEYKARFAIIGAASFATGTLRIVTIVAAVFEMVGTLNLLLPMCVACATALRCAQLVSNVSYYDSLLQCKKMCALPTLLISRASNQVVEKHMQAISENLCLPSDITKARARVEKVNQFSHFKEGEAPTILPIVREMSGGSRVLVGAFRTKDLEEIARRINHADASVSLLDLFCKADDPMEGHNGRNLLAETLTIRPDVTLCDAYAKALNAKYEHTLFVVEGGEVLGLVTFRKLLESAYTKTER